MNDMTRPGGAGVLPLGMRSARIIRAEVPVPDGNAEPKAAREFDVVMTTSAPVRRMRWENWDDPIPYDEILVMEPSAINAERANAGAVPLLDSHRVWGGIDASLGKVLRVWAKGEELWGRVRLHDEGTSEGADALYARILGGTAPSLSIGYTIDEAEVVAAKSGQVEQLRATRWTVFELSAVEIPADMNAGFRSAEARVFPVVINRAHVPATEEEKTMEKTIDASAGVQPAETRAADDGAANAVRAERQRASAINGIASAHNLPTEMVAKAIDSGMTIDAFRAATLDYLATAQERVSISTLGSKPSGDDPAVRRSAMEASLVARFDARFGKRPEVDAHARTFMEHGFAEMAAEALGERSYRMSPAQRDSVLHRAFHATSDFPALLENVTNKVLLSRYEAQAQTFRLIGVERDLRDFKPTSMLRAGDFPNLLQVGETGEIKAGTVGESKETMALATYARQIRISRNVLINDDLGAIADIINTVGTRCADFENATFWALVNSNPALLSDNVAVYHASHGNLAGAGTAITIAALSAGRAAMRKQQSLDKLALNIAPQYLVVGPDKETEAQQLVSPLTPATSAAVNPFVGTLQPVVEANITGNAWHLFANPATAGCFTFGHLEGAPGPQMRSDEPFGVLGYAMQVVLDFGVGAFDYRGTYKNPGA